MRSRFQILMLIALTVVVLMLTACPPGADPEPEILGSWSATSTLNTARAGHSAVAYSGYLYVLGGGDADSQWIDSVEYAAINANGSLGAFAETTALPYGVRYFRAFAYNDRIYIVGGNDESAVIIADVWYAPVNPDGTLGTWVETTSLSSACYEHGLATDGDTIYVFGGGFDRTQTVEYATIASDGSVGAWQSGTALLQERTRLAAVSHGDSVYVVAGDDNDGTNVLDVEYTTIALDHSLGAWSTTTPLTAGRMKAEAVVVGDYLFLVGGSGSYTEIVEYAPFNDNGTIGAWAAAAAPSYRPYSFATVQYGNYIYVIGGYVSGEHRDTVEYAQFQW